MDAAQMLRSARRRAGMTQRELADAAGMPQPTVARIEAGGVSPRTNTLEKLLAAAGFELDIVARIGPNDVDRSAIRQDS